MDDPNFTIKECIGLEEEKDQKCGKVFIWESAKKGKIWYDEDIHDLRSIETEFPSIAFNDEVSSEKNSYEPTVRSLNDEIDFRILFDDFEDEDYTVVFNKNSFSYKIISTNDLKTDSKNDDEKVNLPSIPSPEPAINMALLPRDQRYQYLRYEVLRYSDAHIVDFKARLARIYMREVHRVQVFNFGGLLNLMADELSARMLMEHRDAQGVLELVCCWGEERGSYLWGLTVITPALLVINMSELVSAHGATKDALVVDDDIPQAVPPPSRTQGERIA
nr:hypothetical protein [Tanacetum cinerariifolium]